MDWVKSIIGKITKPYAMFIHTNGSYWTVADPKEFKKHENPLEIYIYQKVCQNRWGKWIKLDKFMVLTDNRYEYAIDNFKLV